MANKIILDLSNYKDRSGSRLPEDTYRVVVDDAEESQSKTGNTMITLFLRVQGGDFDGSSLVDRLVLTEKSMFRVVGFLQAIGMPTPKKRLSISLNQFVGKVLDVQVEDGEPYNGRVKSEVRGYARVRKSEQASAADVSDLADDSDDVEDTTEDTATTAPADDANDPWQDSKPTKASKAKAEPEPDDDDGEVDLDDLDEL